MKFKLDENFGTRVQQIFLNAGHDIRTVRNQKLQGCPDQRLYEFCSKEQRCLVTLDLDFADVTRFPPALSQGVVVLRLPRNSSFSLPEQLVKQFLQALRQMPVERNLWVVEAGRIRIHQAKIETEP